MPELIENGFFSEDELSPWARCANNELGEAWICLADDEPGFTRTAWSYTGGLSVDDGPNFLTEYNLILTGNSGVTQQLAVSLWAQCTPPDAAAGELYAFVCYRDRTFDYAKLTRDGLRRSVGPTRLTIEVLDKTIEKVVICVVGSVAPWYLTGISLPGAVAKMRGGSARPGRFIENRLALLETRMERVFELLATDRRRREKTAGAKPNRKLAGAAGGARAR
jgi:hypothetical protein